MYNFKQTYESLDDQKLLNLFTERNNLVPEAQSALDAEIAKRGISSKDSNIQKFDPMDKHVSDDMHDKPIEVKGGLYDSFQDIEERFQNFGFDKITSPSLANPIMLFIEFLVGGWLFILFNILIIVPSLIIVAILRWIFVKPMPNRILDKKCDLCDKNAVGYKNIHVNWGFLLTFWKANIRAFLCEEHTSELVKAFNILNFISIFCFIGGFSYINNFFRTREQLRGNFKVLPKFAGEPELDPPLEIAKRLYGKAKERGKRGDLEKTKAWLNYAMEFLNRAYIDAINDSVRAEVLVFKALELIQLESLLDRGIIIQREPKTKHLEYLNSANTAIKEALQLLPPSQQYGETFNLARETKTEIDNRIQRTSN